MKTIRFPSHLADVMLFVEADTIQELFEAALEGMNGVLNPEIENTTAPSHEIEIQIFSEDATALLINFLSEILTLRCVNKKVYVIKQICELKENHIKTLLTCMPASSFEEDIKGVSYHNANVKLNILGKWETHILFDI